MHNNPTKIPFKFYLYASLHKYNGWLIIICIKDYSSALFDGFLLGYHSTQPKIQ